MSDDTTHYQGCGRWNSAHARCATNRELMEVLEAIDGEAYIDGLSDGQSRSGRDTAANQKRRADVALYLAEVRRRIGGKT